MFNTLRSYLYIIWLYGSILGLGILWAPSFLLPRPVTLIGIKLWASGARWGLRWICGVKTEIRGMENLPEGPCLVASKHQSMYDILMPFLFLKDPAFVMKRELMYYPIFGWYAWKAAMIPIDRGGYTKTLKQMMRRAKQEVARGRQFLIFPEGTRRLPGAPPAYKSGVFAMYREIEAPCAPVALNTGLSWPRKGITRIPGTIVFEILPPIEPGLPRAAFMEKLENMIEPASERLLDEGLTIQGRTRDDLQVNSPDNNSTETERKTPANA